MTHTVLLVRVGDRGSVGPGHLSTVWTAPVSFSTPSPWSVVCSTGHGTRVYGTWHHAHGRGQTEGAQTDGGSPVPGTERAETPDVGYGSNREGTFEGWTSG